MKKKLFAFILSFTVVAVVVTAVNCGCVFAQAHIVTQTKEAEAGHCDKQHKKEAEQSSESCCTGCKIEMGAYHSQPFGVQFDRTKDGFFTSVFLSKDVIGLVKYQPLLSSALSDLYRRGVSFPRYDQPVYLVFESLLI